MTSGPKMPIRDQAENLKHHGSAHQRGIAGLIKRRGYLHDIAADEIQPAQSAQQALGLQGGQTANFRGAGAGCIHGIEPVHVEGDVGGAVAHHTASFLYDTLDAERREFFDIYDSHPAR